ncbi:hypothetical protein N7516_005683 [Penicillium verrucosum]|uniref:uncharacterized protein n=1 Tax=Penicillium verrucosum TaxID=60171 RepID=UPI0025453D14|nr:uncharacterized protein N7516_005683 [Penicillium verrucosum]KAJ5931194.1 hypothetical protein N7516_005683 [Penicillium verrucosum]
MVEVISDDIHEEERFYSDLSPLSKNIYERTEKELLEHRRNKYEERQIVPDSLLPRLGETHSLTSDEATIKLNRRADIGYFVFSLDVQFSFGLVLPLILTEMEASKIKLMTKVTVTPGIIDSTNLQLEKNPIDKGYGNAMSLPHELRLDILDLAILKQEWEERDPSEFLAYVFPRSVGDLSGFYFPLSQNIHSLLVNKQMRQDALPFVYRTIGFRWDDIDSFIKFAISIGEIGRNNVESLELFWLSSSDSEFRPSPEDIDLRLPALHVLRCVQLLK